MLLPNRPQREVTYTCQEQGRSMRSRMIMKLTSEGLTASEVREVMDATREGMMEVEDARQTYTYTDVLRAGKR